MITVFLLWKDCKHAFTSQPFDRKPSIPMFSTGGGSCQQFGGTAIEMKQKHFYFFKWCFLTIRYDRLPRRKFKIAFGPSRPYIQTPKNKPKQSCAGRPVCTGRALEEPEAPAEQAPGEPEIKKLSHAEWEHKMHESQAFSKVQLGRADYWAGVQRGLRRAYHGANFGTDAEHVLWCAAINSDYPMRKQLGQGYRDGLRGKITR